jgi:hypothetical protein
MQLKALFIVLRHSKTPMSTLDWHVLVRY